MPHIVLYQGHATGLLRELNLAGRTPEFEARYLDEATSDDERNAWLAEAEFGVMGRVNDALLSRMPKLRMVQTGGVGYENLDVAACQRRGIPVAITPEGTVQGVAEHAVILMLAIYKHLAEAHNALKAGEWIHDRLRPICLMLQEKRVGIVGMGRIGREVARRLQGWDVELVYYDINRMAEADESRLNACYLPLADLLRTADVVTLHVFLSEASQHMIGERELRSMKPTAVLLNTSRGGVVDEVALYRVMKEGHLYGAGIDAWQEEPPPRSNPLLTLDNVLVTPHMATANRDAIVKKSQATYANFRRLLRGEAPLNTVRPYGELVAGAAVTR